MNTYSKIAILLTVWLGALSSTVAALELEVGLGVTVERDQNDMYRDKHSSHHSRRLQMDSRPKAAPTVRTEAKESPVTRPKPPERGRRPKAPVRREPVKRQMGRPVRAPARRPN
jgi:hypothetical protein